MQETENGKECAAAILSNSQTPHCKTDSSETLRDPCTNGHTPKITKISRPLLRQHERPLRDLEECERASTQALMLSFYC